MPHPARRGDVLGPGPLDPVVGLSGGHVLLPPDGGSAVLAGGVHAGRRAAGSTDRAGPEGASRGTCAEAAEYGGEEGGGGGKVKGGLTKASNAEAIGG